MSHSHTPINHLLRQVEEYRARKAFRDIRPSWLTSFVESTAELFEPMSDVARVGYDCRIGPAGWRVSMFLGTVETVGGPQDGLGRYPNFEVNVLALMRQFSEVKTVLWAGLPDHTQAEMAAPTSVLMIDGFVETHPVELVLNAVAPSAIGPGLREFPNGQRNIV